MNQEGLGLRQSVPFAFQRPREELTQGRRVHFWCGGRRAGWCTTYVNTKRPASSTGVQTQHKAEESSSSTRGDSILHQPSCWTSHLGPADGPDHLFSQCPPQKGITVTKGKRLGRFQAGFQRTVWASCRAGCQSLCPPTSAIHRHCHPLGYPHAAASLPSHPVGWRRRDASKTAKLKCHCSLFPLLKLGLTRQAEWTPFQGVQPEEKKMQGRARSKDSLAACSPVSVDIKLLKLSEHKISPCNFFLFHSRDLALWWSRCFHLLPPTFPICFPCLL